MGYESCKLSLIKIFISLNIIVVTIIYIISDVAQVATTDNFMSFIFRSSFFFRISSQTQRDQVLSLKYQVLCHYCRNPYSQLMQPYVGIFCLGKCSDSHQSE